MFDEFKGRSLIKFTEFFSDTEKCKNYLSQIKWKDGFKCPSCGHDQSWKGVKPYTKVCKNCRYIESITANTIFHKIKFDLRKAFFILFEMSATTKSCSSTIMSARYEINQKTAWLFMSKVRKAMESSKLHPLKGPCEVGDFTISTDKAEVINNPKLLKKKKFAIAIEKSGNKGIKRAYAVKLNNCSVRELQKLFDDHLDPKAGVVTKKRRGYRCLMDQYNIQQQKSNSKENFQLMQRFIYGLKSWIRGIHHHVSDKYLQGYLNEYCYRFNRNRIKPGIFHLVVERMMKTPPAPYKILYNT
ncbi:MAG: IS1595 family transposase [Candidatus Cyclobacteriaceae bacterium M3_2C_046]